MVNNNEVPFVDEPAKVEPKSEMDEFKETINLLNMSVDEIDIKNAEERIETGETMKLIKKAIKDFKAYKDDQLFPFAVKVTEIRQAAKPYEDKLAEMKLTIERLNEVWDVAERKRIREENQKILDAKLESDKEISKEIIESKGKGEAVDPKKYEELQKAPELVKVVAVNSSAHGTTSVKAKMKWRVYLKRDSSEWNKSSRISFDEVKGCDVVGDMAFGDVSKVAINRAVEAGQPVPAWVHVYEGNAERTTV